ncbi:MAG: GGDEF domain-containing protein, partial [Bacillota bacterium]
LENIAAEIKTAATEGSPLSLAMLDIDYFKKLNDSYGHQVGDQVLVEVSAILRQSLRETDIVCRYGGEEFSIIMPGTTKDRAVDVIERVRSRVESSPMVRSDQENIFITISCGVACCPGDAGDAETLILRSDTALYTAKGTGRNKVVGYDPEQTIG